MGPPVLASVDFPIRVFLFGAGDHSLSDEKGFESAPANECRAGRGDGEKPKDHTMGHVDSLHRDIRFSAIDHRFEWSTVPVYAIAAGDVLVALGLLIIFFVFRVNTFTSGIIEVDTEQKVISTGLYALVRHPCTSELS
jgi:hypothetical protein